MGSNSPVDQSFPYRRYSSRVMTQSGTSFSLQAFGPGHTWEIWDLAADRPDRGFSSGISYISLEDPHKNG